MAESQSTKIPKIISIENDSEFQPNLNNNLNSLIVTFFFASWCDVCKTLIPELSVLAQLRSLHIYFYVDIDKCPVTAKKYDVHSVPTFILFHNKVLLTKLETKSDTTISSVIDSYSSKLNLTTNDILGLPVLPGLVNLLGLYSKSSIECLNDSLDHPCENLISPDNSYAESDCDEQLLITLSFNQSVKLHSLCFRVAEINSAPKVLKLFINLPQSPDFHYANNNTSIQQIELTEEDFLPGNSTKLNFVKFQNVNSITLFVMTNQKESDTTKIQFIGCYGLVKEASNMDEYKRISGKSGESH